MDSVPVAEIASYRKQSWHCATKTLQAYLASCLEAPSLLLFLTGADSEGQRLGSLNEVEIKLGENVCSLGKQVLIF